jgi:ABC-type phosphate transport system substrate-binding protein
MKTLIFISLILLSLLLQVVQAQTVIIVNESVAAKSLSVKELMDVYTLNKTHWDDGSRISVFDLKNGKTKEAFLSYVGMSEDELKRIWLRKQFTGKARPPKAVSSEDEVMELVARTPGAIGYIGQRNYRDVQNVRIIARVK